jgi:hypothetical protein
MPDISETGTHAYTAVDSDGNSRISPGFNEWGEYIKVSAFPALFNADTFRVVTAAAIPGMDTMRVVANSAAIQNDTYRIIANAVAVGGDTLREVWKAVTVGVDTLRNVKAWEVITHVVEIVRHIAFVISVRKHRVGVVSVEPEETYNVTIVKMRDKAGNVITKLTKAMKGWWS